MQSSQSVARKRKPNGHPAAAANGTTAADLDQQELLDALQAMQAGDFSVRLPGSQVGVAGKICDAFNTIVAANSAWPSSSSTWAKWSAGRARPHARALRLSNGAWADMEQSVNTLIDDLLWPTTAVTRTVTAVARGDLLQTVPLDVDGRR
jgi:hypothetical protein